MNQTKETITLCKLKDGTIMPYDWAHNEMYTIVDTPDRRKYEFIGIGKVYSVDGTVLEETEASFFFYRKIQPAQESPVEGKKEE